MTLYAVERLSPQGADSQSPDSQLLEKLYHQLQMYELIMDNIYNGVMVTDAQGYIMCMNAPYGQFLGIDNRQQIGKHCTEVVENTRMHIVAKTGKPEINLTQHIRGQDMVVQRIPIRREGRIVAVFGQVMFKNVKDLGKLARELSLLASQVKLYEQEIMNLRSTRYTLESIVGKSQAMQDLKEEAFQAAGSDSPVLITGESGTGKEVFAQAIHHASLRRIYPFVRINCAAIPRDMMESELFGYAKGAFTGALAEGKPGKFELADKGTVFLDEIGELPLEMQPKLLRVLEEKQFERIGGTKVIQSDFRLIAATNQNLLDMIESRRFRKDLYYRLNVMPIAIQPLQERVEDIIPLAEHILSQLAQDMGMLNVCLSPAAKEYLRSYAWPGNVRELSNVLERTLASLHTETIDVYDLPLYVQGQQNEKRHGPRGSLKVILDNAEKQAIERALQSSNHNKMQAARELGIHRTLLYKKMKKHAVVSPASGGS
ncbi:MAG: sigma 54-interacting transcriptional regulator [Desulfovermiculus sp.]